MPGLEIGLGEYACTGHIAAYPGFGHGELGKKRLEGVIGEY